VAPDHQRTFIGCLLLLMLGMSLGMQVDRAVGIDTAPKICSLERDHLDQG